MSNTTFLPPSNIAYRDHNKKSVFLAGSIEMGKAENWQLAATELFVANDFVVFNPRRPDWNPDWIQSMESPEFLQQVHWEDQALNVADHIIVYLQPGTISPISIGEAYLHATSKKLVVICPHGFHRKGNIDYLCFRYNVPQFDTVEDAMNYLINKNKKS